MPYIAKTDIETFLNITLATNGETLVTALITALDAFADSYCNRTWTNTSNTEITELHDGGTDTFFPANPPIASITSVKVDGVLYDSSSIYNYGSYVLLSTKVNYGYQNIEIKYKTSATAIPADLKHALVQWVSQIFKSQSDAGKVVSKVSTGPVNIEYLTKDGIPQFVQIMLDKYRLTPV
jgi:hypothetical protein